MMTSFIAGTPSLYDGVKFGIGAALVTEQRFAAHMLGRWQCGASSLVPLPTA
jgi:hypothetical protein